MFIRFWGARGSIPVSGPQFIKYGGDTPCVEIRTKNGKIIIIDAGSGLRRLGNSLFSEQVFDYTMLFTHSHWDHIIGFPFFKPIYMAQTSIKIFQMPKYQGSFVKLLSNVMRPPHFPIHFDKLSASLSFVNLSRDIFEIDTMTVKTVPISHPNMGLGFRFEEAGKSFVFLTDNEITFRHRGGLDFDDYVRFTEGADLLVHDAEYEASDYVRTKAWGHTIYTDALRLAIKAGVKSFGLYHHNQDRPDSQIDEFVEDCRRICNDQAVNINCFAVYQDMELIL